MRTMQKLLVGLLLLIGSVGRVSAQEMMIAKPTMIRDPLQMEYHNYSYVVKEDGSARGWLRVDGLTKMEKGGTYQITLPEGTQEGVLGWYRRDECGRYERGLCVLYENQWREAEVKQDGMSVTVVIPPAKATQQPFNYQGSISVGVGYRVGDVTTKKWWGREVAVWSGISDGIVSNLNIGVTMPDGVYVRDYQTGPSQWAASMNEMMMGRASSADGLGKLMGPMALDMAGSGAVSKNWSNLMPGEQYKLQFMSATEIWKLFNQEIGWAILWMAAIGIVFSLLLRMLVGKKPWLWYLGIVILLTLLLVLIGGLWLTYRFSLGTGGGNYPGPVYSIMNEAKQVSNTEEYINPSLSTTDLMGEEPAK